MNPYDEQRLRDEVIYLHSLWHQGPPPPTPPPRNPISIPIPIQTRNNIASEPYIPPPLGPYFRGPSWHHLHHQHTIQFAPSHTRSLPPIASASSMKRKIKNNKRNNKKNKIKKHRRNKVSEPDPPPSPGPEWPCPVSPDPPPETGWPASKARSAPAVSPQEKDRLAAVQAQHKACQAFREFLFDSDDDDDDDDDEDDDVGDDGWEEFEELFVRIFMEDHELRSYYQRCFESGEFCCLVCGAIGKKKSGKKFKDCVGLVQHSMSISRTVKKRAHRAFGQAVCKVLGWDIDRLPTIVMKGVPLGCSVGVKPAEAEGEPKQNVDNDDDGKDGSHKSDDKVVSLDHGDEPVVKHAQGVDQSIGEEGDIGNKAGNLDEKMLDIGLESGGGRATDEVSRESLVSGAEWVCKNPNCDSSSTASGWPSFNTKSSSNTCSLSAEEQASMAVLQLQHKALEACQEYLVRNGGSDCDDDKDNGDEDELADDSDPEECEEFKFFLRLFTEDGDLRRYYENNHREGDFYCLVCGGIGKKIWKRFKDCIALLQHSTAIKRTKRERAHRAYSQVICKVLGWDVDRLPAIVLKGQSLGSSLAGSRNLWDEPEQPADSRIDDSNASIIHEISGEPEKHADGRIDDSNVLQENQAK